METATPAATATLAASRSKLPQMLEKYQKSLQKIDALERRLEEKVAEKRHRAVNLLDEMPSHRRSTLRLFVTHQFEVETKQVPVKSTATETEVYTSTDSPGTPKTAPTPAASEEVSTKMDVDSGPGVTADSSTVGATAPSQNDASAPVSTSQSGTNPSVPAAPQTTAPTTPAVEPAKPPVETEEVTKNKWNLIIEGKLLTGHLDHESSALMEKEAKARAEREGRRYVTQSEMVVDTADMTSRERAATRFMHDREGEEPVIPIKFSHFFDRMSVSFQTFQKDVDPADIIEVETPTKPTRKGRRKSTTPKKTPQTPIKKKPKEEPKDRPVSIIGPTNSLFWNRQRPNPANPKAPLQSALDTHAFHAIHSEECESITKENMVVATIRLHRRDLEQKYKPSAKLCSALFPSLAQKKSKPTPIQEFKAPPKDNDIYIPTVLTMDETIDAIYQYVLKHELQDETDRRTIKNDTALEQLFGCKTMDLGTMKEFLLSRGLLVPCVVGTPGDSPIILTYVMRKNEASLTQSDKDSESESSDKSMEEPAQKRRRTSTPSPTPPSFPDITQNMLSCDVDIDVPHLFHSRCRDILRRIKIREYEYTSCRTKALRTVELTKAAEDVVKDRLENIVKGKALTAGHLPVLLALAKAAPKGSEARISAHTDAKTSLLVERLEEHCERARACWEVVEICRGGIL